MDLLLALPRQLLHIKACISWVFSIMVGRRTPYSVFHVEHHSQLKALPVPDPLAFILSSLILLFSTSALPFETRCIAFSIPYNLF
jgi:hypothetical protein